VITDSPVTDESEVTKVVISEEDNRQASPTNNEDAQNVDSTSNDDTDSATNVPDNSQTIKMDEANNNSAELETDSPSIPAVSDKTATNFIHVLQKDAFLTFWALCKLAVKQSAIDECAGDVSIL